MHKKCFIIVIIILLLIPIHDTITKAKINDTAFNKKVMEYTYNFERPTIKKTTHNNISITKIIIQELPLSIIPQKPAIPKKPVKILLPPGQTVKNIQIEPVTIKTWIDTKLQNILTGSLTHRFDTTKKTIENNNETYDSTKYYPSQNWEKIGIQYKNGFPILHLNLHPVQILKKQNKIKYISQIKVTIETTPTTESEIKPKMQLQNEIIKDIDNPEIIKTYQNQQTSFENDITQQYDYIIITSENLTYPSDKYEYSFNDLIDYREIHGLSCMMKTVESIIDEYQGRDTQEKIRNFIKHAYNNWNTEWILLGGDIEIIPARYLHDIDGQEKDEKKMASDFYYQCLDGSYNYDNDSKWGEEYDGIDGDRIDLLAEVYVGRAPVDDEQDVSAFVEKTLSYEQSVMDEESYLYQILSAGEELWSGPGGYGSGYVERCIDYCEDYNHETYGIPSDIYSINRLYEKEEPWTDDDAISLIDNGVNIINHVGHGTAVSAMKLGTIELEELNNNGKYGLFYTQACHSGEFGKLDECFAEKWVNIPKKGGFAAIMDTGYGYGSASNYDGADNRLAREFYDALFSPNEKIDKIGKANQDSKEDNIWRINDPNMYHAFYVTTLFGDPYVSIHGSKEASADFSYDPLYPNTDESISFYDQSEGSITYREWDFGDGRISHKKNPIHSYGSQGKYTVSLTVMDNQGYISTKTKTVEVKDYWNPIAKIIPSNYNGVNFTISFSAAESWDPDGEIVSYQWDFDDGDTASVCEPVHTFNSEGKYRVSLTVEDDDGNMARAYSNIVLSKQYPPDTPSAPDGPTSTFSGTNYSFSVVTTDPEGDDIMYGWDWNGDDVIEEWTDWYPSGQTCQINHKWYSLGKHHVKVKARDSNYGESNWSKSLKVIVTDESPPALSIEKPDKGIYLSNEKIISFPANIVFGKIDIMATASDASGIEKILFYLDDMQNPKAEVLSEPFVFSWDEKTFNKHRLKIVAIDNAGKQTSCEKTIWKFF